MQRREEFNTKCDEVMDQGIRALNQSVVNRQAKRGRK